MANQRILPTISFRSCTKRKNDVRKYTAGVSLIEVTIVAAIIVTIFTATLFQYGAFRTDASLEREANTFVETVRQAKAHASAVKAYNGDHSVGYGVTLNTSSDRYTFFVDSDGNDEIHSASNDFVYRSGSNDREIRSIALAEPYEIIKITGVDSGTSVSLAEAHVVFFRPELVPSLRGSGTLNATSPCNGHNTASGCTMYEAVRVTIGKEEGEQTEVTIDDSGVIAVD